MKHIKFLMVIAICLFFVGQAYATLTTIGTASYDSDGDGNTENYNLIYDNDSPFGSIVWLDYSNTFNTWDNHMNWAAGLNASGVLTYNLNPGVNVIWNGAWRLPATVDGSPLVGPGDPDYYDGTGPNGFNITTSELGHLFYTAAPDGLGNLGYYDTSGNFVGDGNYGLLNTDDFQNLQAYVYWSGTEYAALPDLDLAWYFSFIGGGQNVGDKVYDYFALAVRPADVTIDQIPEPSSILLLGFGLAGVGLFRRRLKH
jgi:hypothetical protein